jgi:hypothetical protein
MDLKDFGEAIAKLGLPLLGAALPLPGGLALGTALAAQIGAPSGKPEDLLAALATNADAVNKAKQFENEHQEKMLELTLNYEVESRKADSADLATVDATMQEELRNSDKESWYQKAWRPACGFSVALGSFAAVAFVCYLFYVAIIGHDTTALPLVPQLASAVALILGVPGAAVGIAAWHRGREKIAQIQAAAGSTNAR